MDLKETRLCVDDPEQAEELLDNLGYDYDWDSGWTTAETSLSA